MGFYGNITNTSNTTFQFDRIYPNRLNMDANANNDGIFIGRYVLVEYQQQALYPNIYTKIVDGTLQFYSSPNCEYATRIKFLSGTPTEQSQDGFYINEIGQYQNNVFDENSGNLISSNIEFYKCVGEIDGYAQFEKTDGANNSNYVTNYSIDEAHYSNQKGFKGYDSTVWVKVSKKDSNGLLVVEYVNIADLNSVVPTFDITADAPTMTPITPHFDADSTNVYYKLHMQSPYGFRVKQGIEEQSDDDTVWYQTTYNKEKDETKTEIVYSGPADIYYNQAGFDPNNAYSKVSNEAKDNYIKLEPTGESGTVYAHGGQAKDIQEFSLHLPAIGNMMSDAWDIIHGPNRDDAQTDENSSLQGRLDSFKAMEENAIPMKRNGDGTFVGSRINGNNQKTVANEGILNENLSTDFNSDDAWIRTEIKTEDLDNETVLSGISIHHTWHKKTDTTSESDMNDDTINTIELYTPIVDKAGHIVGKNTETVTLPYGYKSFVTDGLSEETEIDLDGATGVETIANSTQDTMSINTKNKWLQIEINDDAIDLAHEIHDIDITSNGHTNLNKETGAQQENNLTIYDWDYDNAGHIIEKKAHTYTLPFGYKTVKTNGRASETSVNSTTEPTTTDVVADRTQDTLSINSGNKWVRIDTNTSGDSLTIRHDVHPTSVSSDTTDWTQTEENTTIPVLVYSFDEAGHYESHHTESYKLPFGYGKIIGDSGNTSASATFDALEIKSGDDWIHTTITPDTISITHTGPVATALRTEANQTPKFGETFEIEDWSFDNKGHKANVSKHKITIPKGSLNDLTATGSSVLTGISMIDETGDITQQNANVGTLTLAEYVQGVAGGLKISNTNTINGAFRGIQDYINNLDMSDTSTTQFITKITQTDGQVAVERAAAGTLQLGTASTDGTIPANSSLNNAFNITNTRIKAEEDALAKEVQDRKDAITKEVSDRNTAISSAISAIVDKNDDGTINKLAEVIEWINNNPSTATQMQKAINENANAISAETNTARAEEEKLNLAIGTEQTRATSRENDLDASLAVEVNRATNAETELSDALDLLEDSLGSAAFTEKTAYATAEQGNTADTVYNTISNYGDIVECNQEDFVSAYDYEVKILALENTIETLRKQIEELNNQINPPQPEEPVPDEGEGEE